MAWQVEFPDDTFLEKTGEIRCGRNAETGPYFLRYGAASDHFSPLEDKDLSARFGKICCRDQAVVTPADNDCVKCFGHLRACDLRSSRWEMRSS